jgi:hypothetical protein
MKRFYRSLFLASAFVVALAGAAAAQTNFVVTLDGAQETPPVATPATGSGTAVLSADETTFTLSYSFSGLTSSQSNAHIHQGAIGVPGGVVKNLPTPNANVVGFVWTSSDASQPLTSALVDLLLAEGLYINIHTTNFPGGEIRGQLLLEPVPVEGTTWGRLKNLLATR